MRKQALQSARDEFEAMKRAQIIIENTDKSLAVRDAWKTVITANYEIGQKLDKAFDSSIQMEKDYKAKFEEQHKSDQLLRYVYLSRKVGTHDVEMTHRPDGVYFKFGGAIMEEYYSLPEPRLSFDSFLSAHPDAKKERVAVILPRFKHLDYGKFKGWVNTPAEHLGFPIVMESGGFTPLMATLYLVRYYEVVFAQLTCFAST